MPDVEQLLRTDARRWNARLGEPPNFDSAVAAATAPSAPRRGGRVPLLVAAVVIAVAAVAVVTVWVGHHGPTQQRQAASILVHGERVPYAGRVPWSDAILDPRNPSRLVVFADGDNMRGGRTCGLPIERPVIQAAGHDVAILIAGYAKAEAPNTACAGVGHGPQRVAVTLPSPLGHRSLIDATTGLRHRVLHPAAVPNLGIPVPTGYVGEPISWDDRTGIVTRSWISKACPTDCAIQLRYAPPTSHAPFDEFGGMSFSGHVRIHHAVATIYTYREQRGKLLLTETALVWTRPDHSRVLISVGGGARGRQTHAPTRAQAIQLARSVK